MSVASVVQMRESYNRVIDETLKQVRDGNVFRGASLEMAAEIGRRWRVALEKRLVELENGGMSRAVGASSTKLDVKGSLEQGQVVGTGTATVIPAALRDRSPQKKPTGWSFVEGPSPPSATAPLPALSQCPGGFGTSQVDSAQNVGGSSLLLGRSNGGDASDPVAKRARVSDPREAAPLLPPTPTPSRSSTCPRDAVVAAAGSPGEGSSDDEYAGCFDDADVITSQIPRSASFAVVATEASRAKSSKTAVVVDSEQQMVAQGADNAEADESGSELGSDFDMSEFDDYDAVAQTQDVLYTVEAARIKRSKHKWEMHFKESVLRIDGYDCLISSGRGVFHINHELGPNLVLRDRDGK